jgi:hypothetical protein
MSERALRTLVERSPGQATLEEYRLVDAVVRARAPCRLLVFGVGRDSAHWLAANTEGTTVFLENDPRWVERARAAVPGIVVHRVRYRTRLFLWPVLRHAEQRLQMGGLPDTVTDTAWDVVFVDGPAGSSWRSPGRMQSIYTAARLADPTAGDVLVHDCHRTVERECCVRYLGHSALVAQIGTMRHYRVG